MITCFLLIIFTSDSELLWNSYNSSGLSIDD